MMMRTVLLAALVAGAGGCDDASDDGANSVDMLPADPVARGHFYVMARGCPTCHQSKAPGDGTLSGTSSPREGTMAYPANLTPDVDTGIGSWPDEIVIRAMRGGVDDEDQPLCPPMPHFDGTGGDGRAMNDDEATSIVAYLRSLPPVHHEVPQSSCPPLKVPPADDPPDLAAPAAPPDLAVAADLAPATD
ncbi:MAG: Class diheme cytochrome c [bacterium]|nr:Class diheme cytochrome c [bacterium]